MRSWNEFETTVLESAVFKSDPQTDNLERLVVNVGAILVSWHFTANERLLEDDHALANSRLLEVQRSESILCVLGEGVLFEDRIQCVQSVTYFVEDFLWIRLLLQNLTGSLLQERPDFVSASQEIRIGSLWINWNIWLILGLICMIICL